MRWLLYGQMSVTVGQALRDRGDTVRTLAELGITDADPAEVLKTAGQRQLDVMTTDADLAAAPFSGPVAFKRSLVLLQLSGEDVEQDDAIGRLFARYKRLSPGRLYTVTASRVKVRQLPST